MKITHLALASLFSFVLAASAYAAGGEAFTNPSQAGPDYAVQGEYVGEMQGKDGKEKWGAQIIALGDGKFEAVGYHGGLPGDGYDGSEKRKATGGREGDVVKLKNDHVTLTIKGDEIVLTNSGGDVVGGLKKVERRSPTLGAQPPAGAVVLFDGTSADGWEKGRLENGLLMQGTHSKQKFNDHTLHLEFLLPFMPAARGQARGNSGLYVAGRYEVQMLDSFGLNGESNECGGIYQASKPKANMCYPPLAWQTYDVDFTAPKFDEAGKKTAKARITVKHNGVVIHEDLELPGATPGGLGGESPDAGPIFLQDHGNPVRYRNIWVVEKK